MPRKLIKRYLPDPETVKHNKYLSVFGKRLHDPQLWHLTRYSVGHAVLVGLFCAFIPVPFQMILAAAGALIFRANVAISVALVWLTNPITMPFIFGGAYLVGARVLGVDAGSFEFELSWQWLVDNFSEFWQPLFLGSFICGLISALLGYAAVRLFWRMHIVNAWHERAKLRKTKI